MPDIDRFQCPGCCTVIGVTKDESGHLIRELQPGEPERNAGKCPKCRQELVLKNLTEVAKVLPATPTPAAAPSPMAVKAVTIQKMNVAKEPDNADMLLSLGALYITVGNYTDAISTLSKVKELDPCNAHAYLYHAIALLKGKISRLCPKNDLSMVLEDANTAIAFGEGDNDLVAQCKALIAYVNYDYYESRSMAAIPSSADLVSEIKGLGVSAEVINSLFILLKISTPKILKF